MAELGVKSACKGYRSGHRIFPSYTCSSVNDEVVHGIGVKERILREGDVISVDVCIRQEGFIETTAKPYLLVKYIPMWKDFCVLLKNLLSRIESGSAQKTGRGCI